MFREYFYFRKSDQRVIVALAVVAIFCIGILVGKQLGHTDTTATADTDRQSATPVSSAQSETLASPVYSAFDPNTVTKEQLVGMGISEKKAQTFINYRNAGKRFYSPDDLLDTYGWTADDIEPLLPYIRIARRHDTAAPPDNRYRPASRTPYRRDTFATDTTHVNRYTSNKFRTLTLVDPNTADTTLLQRIPGIGSYYSRQIVRLRERLGGITRLEQLFEINHFPEEALEWFEIAQTPDIRKINLNRADFKQLAAHPYIGYEHTKALQNYIRLYGPIASADQLAATRIFTPEELEQLLPYIEF